MIRDFTVQCHTTGYVTSVRLAGDHVEACAAMRDRQIRNGWTYGAVYTFRVREWPDGVLYEVTLPSGDAREIAP